MKRSNKLSRAALLCSAALLAIACSKEEVYRDGTPQAPEAENPGVVRIAVRVPSSDRIIFGDAQARSSAQRPATRSTAEEEFLDRLLGGEEHETEIKTLSVYMFALKDGGRQGVDEDYIFYEKHEGLDYDDLPQNEYGAHYYPLEITPEMFGERVRFILTINEYWGQSLEGKTLNDFWGFVADAEISSDGTTTSDRLVGGLEAATATGFPMAGEAHDPAHWEDKDMELTPRGLDLNAYVSRNVARLDIWNDTPNLKVTGVRLLDAASRSFLISQDIRSVGAPSIYDAVGSRYYTLLPTADWQKKFQEGGVAYITPDGNQISRAVNTLKHVCYMYEQTNVSTYPLRVEISYTLTLGGSTEKPGKITLLTYGNHGYNIPHIRRNNIYTVRLGNGNPVEDKLTASLQVLDYTQEEEIVSSLTFDTATR